MDDQQHKHHHEHGSGQCRDLLGNLSEYIDGTLEQQLCAQIEQHMQGCKNCRVVIDSLRKTVSLYHTSVPSPDVPQEVRERLYKCLDLEEFLANQA